MDFILAVGGGSVIDRCKVVSAQAMLDEDIWNILKGQNFYRPVCLIKTLANGVNILFTGVFELQEFVMDIVQNLW